MKPICLARQHEMRFKSGEGPCIWMQAKVVKKKNCAREYDCLDCRFDKAMQRTAEKNRRLTKAGRTTAGKQGKIIFWKDKLKKLSSARQPCIHHMKGQIEFRACHNAYNCNNCDFDQYFYDQYAVHAVVKPIDVLSVHGFKFPHGYYLHPGHTWIKIEEDATVRIGIDDFANRLFGPFDIIASPLMGKKIRKDHPDILLKRGDNQAGLLSPVSGVVTDINTDLREKGDLKGDDPYSKGWIMRVKTDNLRNDLKTLMIGGDITENLEKEVDQLYDIIEETAGPLATDGGLLGTDIYGNLPQMGWDRLTKTFLHTCA